MDASVNRIPTSKDERAYLLGIILPDDNKTEKHYSMQELRMLVHTAGGKTIAYKTINRKKIDSAYIVGKGYLEILKNYINENNIKIIIFDLNNIRPAQIRNLEEYLKCRVVGRTEIILEIFARRAKSSESKIQVELAQLNYILPRLKGYGGVLSRLGGGIGTRGPGEKMLETDRRHILKRISRLKKELNKFSKHRNEIRKNRTDSCKCSVVGYTNAGKSTLINRLAKDDLFVENRLFATLDSYTRKVYLSPEKTILMTDTVGFIKNLPTNLIASFKSTLEEISFSNIILIVADMNSPYLDEQLLAVNSELSNLEAHNKRILFFNKIDDAENSRLQLLKAKYPEAIFGSAISGAGVDDLLAKLDELS